MAAVVLPFVVVVAAIPLLWGSLVGPSDLAVAGVMYVGCGLGVTVGYHRMLTHRAFQAHAATRYTFAILGSMAVQGPVIEWVADHRKHHAHTDREGDPHSPHVGHGAGVRGALRGLWHAHVGWLWQTNGQARAYRYARELVEDRGMRRINRAFPQLVLASLALPALLGFALTGTAARRADRAAVGRFRAHPRAAPRDLVGELHLPLLRAPPVLGRGRVDQRLLARASVLRRVLASQPPRLPSLGRARPEVVGGRSLRAGDPAHAAPRAGMGRRAHPRHAPAAEARRAPSRGRLLAARQSRITTRTGGYLACEGLASARAFRLLS